MRWKQAQCALVAVLAAAGLAQAQARVVISEIEGGGGLTGAQYDRDFIELFNAGNATQDLTGWSLQVATDFGTSTTPQVLVWTSIPLSGTLQPGQHMLVVPVSGRGSTVVQNALPPADIIIPTSDLERNLNSTANAIALLSTTPMLADGSCPVGRPDLVDFIHYGLSNANCFQGAMPVPGPATTPRTVERLQGGCANDPDPLVNWGTSGFQTPSNRSVNVFTSATFNVSTVTNTAAAPVVIRVERGTSTCNPVGTLTGATANLSAFGLSSSQALNDAGVNGDAAAGDGIYSFGFNVPSGQTASRYSVPVTASSTTGAFPSTAVLQVLPPPATNDACGSEITLTGTGVLFDGIINAAQAVGEVDAGTCNPNDVTVVPNSVWFTYTPTMTGGVRVDEFSTEDIVVSVHPSCAGASTICRQFEQGRYFPVEAGVQIWIQVGLELNQTPQVPYDLTLTFEAAPANDTPCGTLPVITPDVPFLVNANAAATAPIDPEAFPSCDQGTNPPEARRGVWHTLTTGPTGGNIFFSERSSNNSGMSVWQADMCNGFFSEVTCTKESSGNLGQALQPSTAYYVLVALDTFSIIPSEPYDGTITFSSAPANDLACGATPLGTLPQNLSFFAGGASHDPGNPNSICSGSSTTRRYGVWFTYTAGPSQTGGLRLVDTSANDIFLTAFTGSDCNSLTPYFCEGNFTTDDIVMPVTPGQTYWLLVSLESTSTTQGLNGNYELAFSAVPAPTNDEPCNATVVTTSLLEAVDARAAGHDLDVSCNYSPQTDSTKHGVWYKVNVPTAKQLRVEETTTDVAVFGLFTGPDCNSLTEAVCRQGSNGDLFGNNAAWFNLQPNTDYWVLVGKIADDQPGAPYNIELELTDALGACCSGSSCSISTQAACAGSFAGPWTFCGDTPQFEDPASAMIPDMSGSTPGELSRTIVAGGPGTATDVKVLVEISHARLGDLHIILTAPNGAMVDLMRRIDDDNDTNCPAPNSQGHLGDLNGVYIFDDQAYSPYGPTIRDAAEYFDSSNLFVLPDHYRTGNCNLTDVSINGSLGAPPIAGNWTLTVMDIDVGTAGTLHRWGLIINGGLDFVCDQASPCDQADFDGSGTVDATDIFIFLDAWFAQNGMTAPNLSADTDGSGTVDATDIFIYLDLWFAQNGQTC